MDQQLGVGVELGSAYWRIALHAVKRLAGDLVAPVAVAVDVDLQLVLGRRVKLVLDTEVKTPVARALQQRGLLDVAGVHPRRHPRDHLLAVGLGLGDGGVLLALLLRLRVPRDHVDPRRLLGARQRRVGPLARELVRQADHPGPLKRRALRAVRRERVGVLEMLTDVRHMLRVIRVEPSRVAVVVGERHPARVKRDDRAQRPVVQVIALVVAPRNHTIADRPLKLLTIEAAHRGVPGQDTPLGELPADHPVQRHTPRIVLGHQRQAVHPAHMLKRRRAPLERRLLRTVKHRARASP